MIILQENNLKAFFISLNKFENKDTGEISYNIDVQFEYGRDDKKFKKIEKIYLKKDLSIENIDKLSKFKMGENLIINKNIVLVD